jgi:hypothetical protein
LKKGIDIELVEEPVLTAIRAKKEKPKLKEESDSNFSFNGSEIDISGENINKAL